MQQSTSVSNRPMYLMRSENNRTVCERTSFYYGCYRFWFLRDLREATLYMAA